MSVLTAVNVNESIGLGTIVCVNISTLSRSGIKLWPTADPVGPMARFSLLSQPIPVSSLLVDQELGAINSPFFFEFDERSPLVHFEYQP